MKITGSHVLHAAPERAWEALLDPAVLVATIPGCERLVATAEHSYDMTVTAGVAAITGTYTGTCELTDLQRPHSLVMRLQGAGAPGTIGARVDVRFTPGGAGESDGVDGDGSTTIETTTIEYAADAVVGGMIGGVGQRMLGSVSRRMAGEFFGAVDRAIAEGVVSTRASSSPGSTTEEAGSTTDLDGRAAARDERRVETPPAVGRVFTAPPRPATGTSSDFLRGIAVGAGLVLVGVVAGGVLARRWPSL